MHHLKNLLFAERLSVFCKWNIDWIYDGNVIVDVNLIIVFFLPDEVLKQLFITKTKLKAHMYI